MGRDARVQDRRAADEATAQVPIRSRSEDVAVGWPRKIQLADHLRPCRPLAEVRSGERHTLARRPGGSRKGAKGPPPELPATIQIQPGGMSILHSRRHRGLWRPPGSIRVPMVGWAPRGPLWVL